MRTVICERVLGRAVVLCTLAWMFDLGGTAAAQQAASNDDARSSAQSQALLRERNRATMHPGNPLTIVGLEQGGNDIRSRTPALVSSDRAAAHVDPEELYRRTLAMYETGATFHRPLPALPGTAASHSREPPLPSPVDPVEKDSGGNPTWWWIVIAASAILAGWVLKRLGLPGFIRGAGRS